MSKQKRIIVVAGLDEEQRPHAARFVQTDEQLAARAASLMGFKIGLAETSKALSLARGLAKGRVFGERAETLAFLNTISFTRNAGRCAICRTTDGKLVKDYCRQSGRLRELLCSRCNHGLGCFADDLAKVLRALAYLMKHSALGMNQAGDGKHAV